MGAARAQEIEADVRSRLLAAADAQQDAWGSHPVPSPSGVLKCKRSLWYTARGVPVTDKVPFQSMKRLDAGKQSEPFWHQMYADADFTVLALVGGSRIKVGEHMTAEFDSALYDKTDDSVPLLLAEFKDMGGWGYMNCVLDGVQASEYDYYMQMQLYMGAMKAEACVFTASLADPTTTLWLWNNIKKQAEEDFPPFYVEVVLFNEGEYNKGLEAAALVAAVVASDAVPPPDYAPTAQKNKKDRNFPCGTDERAYCSRRKQCIADGG